MAKKKNIKTEPELVAIAEPLVTEVVAIAEPLATEVMTNEKISQMSLMELVYAEKAAKIICQRYENSIKNYDGSIARNRVEYNKFKQFNNLHQELLDKIEETLSRLK